MSLPETQPGNEEVAVDEGDRSHRLAMLAHDLRNSLAALRTAVGVLKSSDQEEAVVRRALGIMDRQIQKIVGLSDDLAVLSRSVGNAAQTQPEAGAIDPKPTSTTTAASPGWSKSTTKCRVLLVED